MAKSSKPTGLGVDRKSNKFVCTWKPPSNCESQKFDATLFGDTATLGKSVSKKTVEIDLSGRYPAGKKLTTFTLKVKAKCEKKDWSDWADKSYTINPPKKPTISAELTAPNQCKFTWNVDKATNDSWYPFTRVQIQSKLVKDCTWDPKDDDWKGAAEVTSNKASHEKSYTETTSVLAQGSYTRIVRIRAQGPGGDSGWAYSKWVYATPKQAEQTEGEVNETSAGYDIFVKWDTTYDKSTPIDETDIEWVITTPNSDMSCPTGLTWNIGVAGLKNTQGNEGAHINVTSQLGPDQCLYTRVNNKHDDRTTYGSAVLQRVGKLSAPTGLSVDNVDQESQTAKITATNASAVSGSVIEIIYRKNGSETIVGTLNGSPNYKTVKCPAWTSDDDVSFGVRAVLPKSSSSTTSDGVTIYTIEPYMESDTVWQSGTVAVSPSTPSLTRADKDIRVSWTNNWEDANMLELSWSDNPNAWESTDDPNYYEIDNPFATSWRIADLEEGKTWFVRLRAAYDSGNGRTYSPYSGVAQINLSSSPNTPVISLSQGIIAAGQGFTASWEYASTDGTDQSEARIFSYANGAYTEIGRVSTQEHIDLPGWPTPGTYAICVEVVSASGQSSGKSDPVTITVAPLLSCSMVNSLQNITVTDDDQSTRTVRALTALPLTVTVTGADTGGITAVDIRRAEAYRIDRPDESDLDGYADETIVSISQTGDDQISIGLDDLLGSLDDGAKYILTATVKDSVGQTASAEEEFAVAWSHQALMPSGQYIIDEEALAAIITPEAPAGTISTDRCDIYRLSADKPVLVYKDAEFGETYVDPYPAIGENGGYRFVFRTANGDYITADNLLAIYDAEDDKLNADYSIIDFDGNRVILRYDLDLSMSWEKDFEEKKFLGGSIKGFWKKGVSRKGTISAISIPADEENAITSMRRLCEYTERCHIRTPEGSCYVANVSASENWRSDTAGKAVEFSLTITRVEASSQDGMTYEEWQEVQ